MNLQNYVYCRRGPEKCVNMCDEISLWFAEGKYVVKAMDLKKKYESLTSITAGQLQ